MMGRFPPSDPPPPGAERVTPVPPFTRIGDHHVGVHARTCTAREAFDLAERLRAVALEIEPAAAWLEAEAVARLVNAAQVGARALRRLAETLSLDGAGKGETELAHALVTIAETLDPAGRAR